jgi:hypothetical protein
MRLDLTDAIRRLKLGNSHVYAFRQFRNTMAESFDRINRTLLFLDMTEFVRCFTTLLRSSSTAAVT